MFFGHKDVSYTLSHPTRGAWIEISATNKAFTDPLSRTLPGVRGLKYNR